MRIHLLGAALAAACCVALAAPAMAADTTITLPWGDLLGQLLGEAAGILAVVLLGVVTRFLPSTLKAWLTAQRTAQIEQLLERALGFAAQKIAAEAKGKTSTFDVHNELVANGLQYAIDHGSEALLKWAGGQLAVEQKLVARIPSSPSVKSLALAPAAAAP